MRIGLLVPGFSADAEDWCIPALRDLVTQLARTDEVHVIALRYPYQPGDYAVFGAQVTALGGGARAGLGSATVWRGAWRAIATAHRRSPFDVLHAFWANETGAVAALAGRALRIPTIVSLGGGELVYLRDIDYGGQRRVTERLRGRLALRLADVVTAGSRTLLARARGWIGARPAARMQCVPLGVDRRLFSPAGSRAPAEAPRLVQAASLAPVKDQATLLAAAAQLAARGQPFTLEIVGSGPLQQELCRQRDRLGLQASVYFRGQMRHEQLPAVYRQASVYVQSSRHEAQGMAVLEAAACGVPVVGTAVGVLPELAPDAAAAVPGGDAAALAAALAGVLADEPRRAAMGHAAQARVAAEFDLVQTTDRFRQIYGALP
jgi:glycosyltransferase involved in cell wall biosynthesis